MSSPGADGPRAEFPKGRAALVIGHPGHELRVHHWLERTRPIVFVITDGSGHSPVGRLGSTDRVIRSAGATPGPIYGHFTDRQIYEHLVSGDTGRWVSLAAQLAICLRTFDIDYVVSDAAEGFNPTHDLCRYVTDAALALAARDLGRTMPAYEFDLDASPDSVTSPAVRLVLDEAALERKVSVALGYAEMRGEVEGMLARFGRAAFGTESFREARSGSTRWTDERHAEYERYGRDRLADGIYRTLITYREHLAPVQAALHDLRHTMLS